jgi:hypothetical protein
MDAKALLKLAFLLCLRQSHRLRPRKKMNN